MKSRGGPHEEKQGTRNYGFASLASQRNGPPAPLQIHVAERQHARELRGITAASELIVEGNLTPSNDNVRG